MSTSEQVILDSICSQAKEKSCSRCAVSFTCGPTTAKECWCEQLPHVSLVAKADQDCLCPQCLTEAIANLPKAGTHISISAGSAMTSPPTLAEGEDYYCEGPAIVFTARYLLHRGYCCESDCRHCPYKTARGNSQPIRAPQ